MPFETARARISTALLFALILFVIVAVASRCASDPVPVEPGPTGSGTLAARPPSPVVIAGPSGASIGSRSPAPIVAVLPDGRSITVRPSIPFAVGAVVAIPGRSAAAVPGGSTGDSTGYTGTVLLAVEGRRAGLLPDFRRPVVGVVALDSTGRALEGAQRPVVASQARPPVQVSVTVRAGVQSELDVLSGTSLRPAVFVAVSPVRIWGFRPDGALSARRDSAGAIRLGASAGVSVDLLPALAVRVGYGVAGADSGPLAGVAFRF